jgi:hypothetical protein
MSLLDNPMQFQDIQVFQMFVIILYTEVRMYILGVILTGS